MKIPFFNIYLSYQAIEPLHKCPICKTMLRSVDEKHNCQNIAVRRLINKRVFWGTVKATLVCGIIGITLSMGVILYLQRELIHNYTAVISTVEKQMGIMYRTTALVIKSDPYDQIPSQIKEDYYDFITAQSNSEQSGGSQNPAYLTVRSRENNKPAFSYFPGNP